MILRIASKKHTLINRVRKAMKERDTLKNKLKNLQEKKEKRNEVNYSMYELPGPDGGYCYSLLFCYLVCF
jgi:hypothetical protein